MYSFTTCETAAARAARRIRVSRSGPGRTNDPGAGVASMAVDFSLALSHMFLNELIREFREI